MAGLKMICDYRDDDRYRRSFDRLARKVFNIRFEQWHQKGFWDHRYVCYSYADADEVVANVSLNRMNLILDGDVRRAAQIGTVMTHPDYRRRGLAGDLINAVLRDCENEYDLIYIIGDRALRDYYPRFGFSCVPQTQFTLQVDASPSRDGSLRKLHTSEPRDLKLIRRLAGMRRPVSRVFGVRNAEGILMWYCFNVLRDCFYYWEEQDIAVVSRQKGHDLHLFDIISTGEVVFTDLLPRLISQHTERVTFHFTPDRLEISARASPLVDDDMFFVRTDSTWTPPRRFKYPATAQA